MFGLYRSRHRILTGVAAGVAARAGVHPNLVRIAWFVSIPFTLFTSAILYGLLAVLLPVEPEGRETPAVGANGAVRQAFAGFWALHGIAHVVGFMAAWRLTASDSVPYTTSILGGSVDLGETGIRILGLVWLAMVPLFAAAAIATARNARVAAPLLAVSASASLAICLLQLPAAIVGLWINVGALGLLAGIALHSAVRRPRTAVAR